mmetsp:Transcript_19557/g.47766  ORF Transcript_19557/g.47766 Transcript_19557/m.47766 type:complete len:127 (-) Transcript_19557:413-793(-)|eukprot:CAMPEP_0114516730 /NCGR_PEP_ID=MMETSP0109-20121206/17493_1 /TAXON_ID=29199 /ORGANISM="Chlorarachnion reptans, Strain CCCM449" /LENGTH=126 /DNA_ID=CAMNT_0001697157 /DNA_START=38 /DNA_END=418 /DNA_ORIENTATION=-
MSGQGDYLTKLRNADKKAQEIINEAYEMRRVKKQQVEAQANKELEGIKKKLADEILGGGGPSKSTEEQRQKLKSETAKKLKDLKTKAATKKDVCLSLVLHFVTKVNPKATKENVQAYQQKNIASVA